jgi:3-oxoacyl-(acyl-carrier-protein) synthase
MTADDRICVAGIGIASTLGVGTEQVWARLERAEAASSSHIRDLDPARFIKRRYLRPLDEVTLSSIAMVGAAIADAGLAGLGVSPDRVGVVVGSMFAGIGCIFSFKQACHEGKASGYLGLSPLFFPGIVYNSLSGQPAIEFGFTGPNMVVNAGHSSGLLAVIKGAEYLRHGKADVIIAGGAEMIHPFVLEKLRRERGTSEPAHTAPEVAPSAGVCLFVLRRQSDAGFSGQRHYGTLEGWSAGFSGGRDRGPALAKAMRTASLGRPEAIRSVVTDVPLADLSSTFERAALDSVTGHDVPRRSNKTSFGNTLGASSSLNLFHGLMLARSVDRDSGVLVDSVDARGNHAFMSVKGAKTDG